MMIQKIRPLDIGLRDDGVIWHHGLDAAGVGFWRIRPAGGSGRAGFRLGWRLDFWFGRLGLGLLHERLRVEECAPLFARGLWSGRKSGRSWRREFVQGIHLLDQRVSSGIELIDQALILRAELTGRGSRGLELCDCVIEEFDVGDDIIDGGVELVVEGRLLIEVGLNCGIYCHSCSFVSAV